MARRTAHLCIGLPGALGATSVADLLAGHRDTLAVTGHRVAADPDTSRRATWEITHDAAALAGAGLRRRDVEGAWEDIWRRAHRARPHHVVLAAEELAGAAPDEISLALDATAGFRTHVVLVVADPADLLARTWTDAVREGRPMPLLRFRERPERGPAQDAFDVEAGRWWAARDLPRLLAAWGAHVPADRLHVVVVGGDESARVRQAGAALGRLLGTPPLTAHRPEPTTSPRALPSTVMGAMRREARSWVELLRTGPYDVLGDLDALVPAREALPARHGLGEPSPGLDTLTRPRPSVASLARPH